jgi:hypothetical protein
MHPAEVGALVGSAGLESETSCCEVGRGINTLHGAPTTGLRGAALVEPIDPRCFKARLALEVAENPKSVEEDIAD